MGSATQPSIVNCLPIQGQYRAAHAVGVALWPMALEFAAEPVRMPPSHACALAGLVGVVGRVGVGTGVVAEISVTGPLCVQLPRTELEGVLGLGVVLVLSQPRPSRSPSSLYQTVKMCAGSGYSELSASSCLR